jgi:hypothetical protein
MLEIRPNCECCDKDLPPESPDALVSRPRRPADKLALNPASTKRVVKPHGHGPR